MLRLPCSVVSCTHTKLYLLQLLISPPGRHFVACRRRDYVSPTISFFNCRPSFDNWYMNLNAYCCVNTPSMKKLLWLKIWWTSVKGCCHSNHFCGAKRRLVGMKRLHCLCRHFTTVRDIAKPVPLQKPLMYPLPCKISRDINIIEMLWCVCENMYVCVVSARVYRLIFTKLSVNVERLVGFIAVYLNCDGLSRDVAMVTDLWRESEKVYIPCLHSVSWHSITVESQNLYPYRDPGCTLYILKKNHELWSSNLWDLLVRLRELSGCTYRWKYSLLR